MVQEACHIALITKVVSRPPAIMIAMEVHGDLMNTTLNVVADAGMSAGAATTAVDIPVVLTPPVRARVLGRSPSLALDPDHGRHLVRNTAYALVRVRGTESETMATRARAVRRVRTTGMLRLVSAPVPVPAPSGHLLALVRVVLAVAVAFSALMVALAAVLVAPLVLRGGGVAPRVDTRRASLILILRANVRGARVNTRTTSAIGRHPVVPLVPVLCRSLLDAGSWVKSRKCRSCP